MRVPSAKIKDQLVSVFQAWGMSEAHAEVTAEMMVETDLRGVDSHGISMLPTYDGEFRNGRLNMRPVFKAVRDAPASALIDADASLGHPVSVYAMNMAVDKCRESGVAVVSVFNSHHFGAAGCYSRIAADRGVIGMVTSATRGVTMVPTFAAEPVLGDPRTANLIVTTTEKEMDKAVELINLLDSPTKQVLIEARLLETSRNRTTVKGIDWAGTFENQRARFGNNLRENTAAEALNNTLSESKPTLLVDTAKGFNPATAFLDADGLSAVLSFFNKDTETEVVATPRAVMLDNQQATLSVTRAFPIFQVTPLSRQVSPTPRRSRISKVRLEKQMAREPSPIRSASSSTTTGTPRSVRSMAAVSPTGPAPTTATGWRTGWLASWSGERR